MPIVGPLYRQLRLALEGIQGVPETFSIGGPSLCRSHAVLDSGSTDEVARPLILRTPNQREQRPSSDCIR